MGCWIERAWRITLAACVAAAVLWSSAGVSIVQLVPAKALAADKNEAWPCRYHNCGCINAEFCRNHCQCFKPQVVEVKTEQPRSCCTKQEETQVEQANDHSPTIAYMTLQSPQCSGKNNASYFKIIVSQVEPLVVQGFILDRVEEAFGMSSLLHSQCHILLDPPPPRRV